MSIVDKRKPIRPNSSPNRVEGVNYILKACVIKQTDIFIEYCNFCNFLASLLVRLAKVFVYPRIHLNFEAQSLKHLHSFVFADVSVLRHEKDFILKEKIT